ncbi:MAG: malto-oligosyltrehalose synthase [Steroidobacteraceae bacterium]
MAAPEAANGGIPTGGIPRATYRLQLNRDFTLRDATALVPYFAELGVSHLYCSPYMRARPGSTHGYDVVDHNSINPEIGTLEDLDAFVAALRAHGMGHILDWVPNHVGIMGADNAWWMDVLENGQSSVYAEFFDIDWENIDPALAGRVLVPVLGDYYGSALERGELALRFEEPCGAFAVYYHEHRFPVDPRGYPRILERSLESAELTGLGAEERADFSSLIAAFGHLPDRRELAPAAREERQRDKEAHKRRLMRLCGRAPGLSTAIDAAVRALNGASGEPASFDALHRLLEAQAYRLAYWRVASDEINYRRFFDVNDLAALRMENDSVFEATHGLVLKLIAAGKVDGLRIDHPDGLYDPAQYFRRLQSRVADERRAASAGIGSTAGAANGSLSARETLPLYLVVEKITADFEPLRADWAVHGATGYRFVNVVNGLFVDGAARARLDRIYGTFTAEHTSWSDLAREMKQRVVDNSLAAELNVLAAEISRIARSRRSTRDVTQRSLRQALAEVIACFPVYRTYIAANGVGEEDRRYIDWALALARRRDTSTDPAVYDFIGSILLAESPEGAARRFAMRFQQVTAPVTAKGVEDTALYRFNRLISLNEVGGEPDRFGTSVRAFHADARQRALHWPHELLATSTHDTKRSEDVRARIDVLSEMPRAWRGMLERWKQMNRSRRKDVEGLASPSPNDEYLLYQTLIGSLPLDFGTRASQTGPRDDALRNYVERIESYMVKAVREAAVRTSWTNVNEAYEEALRQFVRSILEPRPGNLFLVDLAATVERIARFGLLNSLSQTLCKLTAPGVPDIYQGTELWDFSLVDPDNRRPVDYETRRRLLRGIGPPTQPDPPMATGTVPPQASASRNASRTAAARELADSLNDGRAKLLLIRRALELRRANPELFASGAYLPLRVAGPRSAHLIAFMRRRNESVAIAIAPRLYARLDAVGVWADTQIELPRRIRLNSFSNVLDGATVAAHESGGREVLDAAETLASFPVALLTTTANT